MGLPFLKPKSVAALIIAHRKSNGSIQDSHMEGEPMPELIQAAEDLMSAFNNKDARGVAMAIQSAFELIDSMPHSEGEHIGE
jgi:hypothetical protein